ncbi:MAG: DinB family protein [Acidobacteriota bacterium]
MTDVAQNFLGESRRYLQSAYLAAIERSVAPLTDAQVWWRPNEASNSIGNLILHLSGNVRQWIVGGVGRRPNERNRQQEFDERKPIPKEQLLARLRAVLQEADEVLASVTEAGLTEPREIQGHDTTVLKAIYHVVEHFSTHTGQILWIAKSQPGAP